MPPSTWKPFVAKDSRCGWMTSLMTAQSHQRELGYLQGAGKPPGSRHDSPDELKRASFHFLPNYGTILPSSGATFCHCQAQSDASGEKFREVYHRHSEYAFRLQEACFAREKPYSQFYPSPFTFSPETPINNGVVRGEGSATPFTRIITYVLDIYVVSVKGEGCF